MSTLEQIEAAILTLPSDELLRLKQWFADIDYQRWDEQLEQDVADGKLDALAAEAIAEFNAGKCREIWCITPPGNFGSAMTLYLRVFKAQPINVVRCWKLIHRIRRCIWRRLPRNIWSVRAGIDYRALGVEVEGGISWFWIGTHAEYDKLIGKM
jgi:hypothetical protein